MARRGILAQLIHTSNMIAREQARAERQAARERVAATRRSEIALRAERTARAKRARASEKEKKQLDKSLREAHVATQEARAEEKSLRLAERYDAIDSLLAATLDVDDYVDLNAFRAVPDHPPFDRSDLEKPIPPPAPLKTPAQPVPIVIDKPRGLNRIFGRKAYEAAVQDASERHERALAKWQATIDQLPALRKRASEGHVKAEASRIESLRAAREKYDRDCRVREEEAAESNRQLEKMIADLAYGAPEAVQSYVSVVLANSAYPKDFEVDHEFAFDSAAAELRLRVLVPGPDALPTAKAYKYTRATDKITATELSKKACKDRYANAVHQVALRSIHEVFEADRRGIVKTIALEVGTEATDPATGLVTYIPFVIAAAERETFRAFDLKEVVPSATLARLSATVSKNPYELVSVTASGVRKVE